MRYLLTGGAGFIGSHLTELLLSQGHHVTILDDLSTGRESNLARLKGNPNLQVVRDTVLNESTVSACMANVDRVFHLASAVGVQLIVDQPVHTIRTTIGGTEVVMAAAHKFGRPVLITSSSEVYGKGARVPFSEEDDVVLGSTRHSRWCYAYAKGVDEFLGLAYHRQYELPVTIVRLFNTVGPRQVGQYGMVLPRFVDAAIAGQTIRVTGDGSQTRCFTHVADVVAAMAKLMESPAAVGQVYNLGSDHEISINDLAARVISACGSVGKPASKIEHVSYEAFYGRAFDDMMRRVPNLSKIRTAIGYAPKFNLDQIIAAVVQDRRSAV